MKGGGFSGVKSQEKPRAFNKIPKQLLVAKNTLLPAHHLFDLLEQEISRHKNHTNQSYFINRGA